MKTIKSFVAVFIIITALFITGCVDKTPLKEENKIFAGKWMANDGTWIQIYNDGSGSFEMSNSNVTGGATVITDSTIEIGLMGLDVSFSIDKRPYEEDGETKMQLKGNIYVKQ